MLIHFIFRFYGQEIRAYQILSGEVDPPTECLPLYQVLERHREKAKHEMILAAKRKANKVTQSVGEKFQDRISVSDFKLVGSVSSRQIKMQKNVTFL